MFNINILMNYEWLCASVQPMISQLSRNIWGIRVGGGREKEMKDKCNNH